MCERSLRFFLKVWGSSIIPLATVKLRDEAANVVFGILATMDHDLIIYAWGYVSLLYIMTVTVNVINVLSVKLSMFFHLTSL